MNDLAMVHLCAKAMGYKVAHEYGGHLVLHHHFPDGSTAYNPLTNDEQAMALVKKLHLSVSREHHGDRWGVGKPFAETMNADLNRAIVECVAKMQRGQSSGDKDD